MKMVTEDMANILPTVESIITIKNIVTKGREATDHKQVTWYAVGNATYVPSKKLNDWAKENYLPTYLVSTQSISTLNIQILF